MTEGWPYRVTFAGGGGELAETLNKAEADGFDVVSIFHQHTPWTATVWTTIVLRDRLDRGQREASDG